jgi:hypothetical protein
MLSEVIESRSTVRLAKVPVPAKDDPERIKLWIEVLTGTEMDDQGTLQALDFKTWKKLRERLKQLGGPSLR